MIVAFGAMSGISVPTANIRPSWILTVSRHVVYVLMKIANMERRLALKVTKAMIATTVHARED